MSNHVTSGLLNRISLSHLFASYTCLALLVIYVAVVPQQGFTPEYDQKFWLFALFAPLILPFFLIWGIGMAFETGAWPTRFLLVSIVVYVLVWFVAFVIVRWYVLRRRNV